MNVLLCVELFLIFFGLAVLWRMGDFVVYYIMKIANAYSVSTFFLGFVVLAITANIPELAIALSSAMQGAAEVAVGNIIGANFTDMALIVGIVFLFAGNKMTVQRTDGKKLLYILTATAGVLALVFMMGSINRWQGLGLILLYAVAIVWLWKTNASEEIISQDTPVISQAEQAEDKKNIVMLVTKLLASFGVVMATSCFIVHCAEHCAYMLHVPLESIGATILGVGTSLPELVLSINALRRGDYALAIGPTLGTVLSQTTFILGILAFLSPTPVMVNGLTWAFWFMFAAFGVIAYALISRRFMGRATGAALVSLFITYLGYKACIGL